MKKEQNKPISNQILVDSPIKLMLQVLIFCTASCMFGYFFHPYFTAISLKQLSEFTVQTTQMDSDFQLKALFVASFGLIPILFFTIVKILKSCSKLQKIALIGSILLAGIIFWQFQMYNLHAQFEEFIQSKINEPINYVFARESLYLEFNLLIGFILGAIIATLTLRIYIRNNKY